MAQAQCLGHFALTNRHFDRLSINRMPGAPNNRAGDGRGLLLGGNTIADLLDDSGGGVALNLRQQYDVGPAFL